MAYRIAVADLLRWTDFDDLAGVEHEDAFAQFEHEADIVLDQQHADPEFSGNPLDDNSQIVAFMFGHAGCGLVQQEIAGIAHDGAADGDAPLVGVGQGPGDRGRQVRYAQPVHHALGLRDRIAPGQTEAHAGDLQIVQNRQLAKKAARLKSAGHALVPQLVGRDAVDRFAFQLHGPPANALKSR